MIGVLVVLLALGLAVGGGRGSRAAPPPAEFGAELDRILERGSCVCVLDHEGQHWFLDDKGSIDAILTGRHDLVRGAYVKPPLSRRRAMKVAEEIGASFIIRDTI